MRKLTIGLVFTLVTSIVAYTFIIPGIFEDHIRKAYALGEDADALLVETLQTGSISLESQKDFDSIIVSIPYESNETENILLSVLSDREYPLYFSSDDDDNVDGAKNATSINSLPLVMDASTNKIEIENLGGELNDVKIYLFSSLSDQSYAISGVNSFKYGSVNVISRQGWGCHTGDGGNDPASPYYCDGPFWGASYNPTTHITIHHTATSNGESDWAAAVRAIWYYHSHVRDADPDDGVTGWTDIGYQYLIDPNGVIYEGRYGNHLGEDDESVTGGHVLGDNRGNIGIAMIGTFTSQGITPQAKASLESLIQAIVDQKQLNPFSNATSISGTNKHVVSGHRDWSSTQCPGDQLYPVIDSLSLVPYSNGITKPVYRFLNKDLKIHFYTASYTEKNTVSNLLANTWQYEGIGYQSSAVTNAGTRPVYRFLHKTLKIHFYTASESEKNTVINNLSSVWQYEGVVFQAFNSNVENVRPVYRFLNKTLKVHFYTASESEKNSVINNLSHIWQYEGIAYYAK